MKFQNLDCGTRKPTLRQGRVAFHEQYNGCRLDGRLQLVSRFLCQPSICSGQALSSPDGSCKLSDVHQHNAWCIRVHTSLTEELTRFRSILGGADGRGMLGRRSQMTDTEETDNDVESRVDHIPILVCHLRDRRRHDNWCPPLYFTLIMVVTRRPPPPPTPSSRSSSNQTVPRMAKVKVNQLNQPEHSSPLANGKPKTADLVVSNCLHGLFRAPGFMG